MKNVPPIETARTLLREVGPAAGDLDALIARQEALEALPEYAPLLKALLAPGFYYPEFKKGLSPDEKPAEIIEFLRKYIGFRISAPRKTYGFIVEDKITGAFTGFAEIEDVQEKDGLREASFGIFISPEKHRQGFALEISRGLIPWAFEHLALARLKFIIDPVNAPSIELFSKSFPTEFAGLHENPYQHNDGPGDREVYFLYNTEGALSSRSINR